MNKLKPKVLRAEDISDDYGNAIQIAIKGIIGVYDKKAIEVIKEYVGRRKEEYGEHIYTLLIEEEKLEEIIRLGIEQYEKRKSRNCNLCTNKNKNSFL